MVISFVFRSFRKVSDYIQNLPFCQTKINQSIISVYRMAYCVFRGVGFWVKNEVSARSYAQVGWKWEWSLICFLDIFLFALYNAKVA